MKTKREDNLDPQLCDDDGLFKKALELASDGEEISSPKYNPNDPLQLDYELFNTYAPDELKTALLVEQETEKRLPKEVQCAKNPLETIKKSKTGYPSDRDFNKAKHTILENGTIMIWLVAAFKVVFLHSLVIAEMADPKLRQPRGKQGKVSAVSFDREETWTGVKRRHFENQIAMQTFKQIMAKFLSYDHKTRSLIDFFFGPLLRAVFRADYVRICDILGKYKPEFRFRVHNGTLSHYSSEGETSEDYELRAGVNGRLDVFIGCDRVWLPKKSVQESGKRRRNSLEAETLEEDRMEAARLKEVEKFGESPARKYVSKPNRGPSTQYGAVESLLEEMSDDKRRSATFEAMKHSLREVRLLDYPNLAEEDKAIMRSLFGKAWTVLGLESGSGANKSGPPTDLQLSRKRKLPLDCSESEVVKY